MEEEEDDYMSEKILTKCAQSDVRPGLIYSNKLRREHEQFKKKQDSTIRPFQELAEERRVEGLKTALPDTNKGYALLKKMGYIPGPNKGEYTPGPCVPLAIEPKKDNFGLGFQAKLKEKRKYLHTTGEYRKTLKKRQKLTELKMDYSAIRRMCRNFDEKDDMKKPLRKWYWPENANLSDEKSSSDSSESESDSDSENKKTVKILPVIDLEWRLHCIVTYMREKYNYCMWCGLKFDDEKDMTSNCPGRTRKKHTGDADENDSDSDD